jgi:hypothetical protein
MNKIAIGLLAAGLLMSAEGIAAQTSPESLVTACKQEAKRSHELAMRMEPSLRNVIEGHRASMSAACSAFIGGTKSTTAALSQCLHEASMGPRHIQRDRNVDRAHVERQESLCRALVEATARNATVK